MQPSSGVSISISGRNSPQSSSINEDDTFFRKQVNIHPSSKIKVVVVENHNEVVFLELSYVKPFIGTKAYIPIHWQ